MDAQKTLEECEVVIIGAGLSGLSAANTLWKAGVEIRVLESSERLGGRTYGEFWEAAGREIDLGGTWLLPSFHATFELLNTFGIDTVESPTADRYLTHFSNGVTEEKTLPDPEADLIWDLTEQMRHIVEASTNDFTASEALACVEFPERLSDWHLASQRYLVGAPLEDFDSGHLFLHREDLLDPDHYHTQISGTTKALVQALAANLTDKIYLNTSVCSVSHQEGRYLVSTQDGEILSAKNVIVAVPRNKLREIAFTPAPEGDLAELISEPHVGASRKDWFILEGVERHLRVFASEGPFGYFLTEEKLPDGSMLAVGLAPQAEGLPEVEEFESALQMYAPGCRVRAHLRHDWVSDEHAHGTWLGPRPGDYRRNHQMTSPLPSLRFVGGDFSTEFPGTIEGAIRTGQDAAETLLSL